MRGKFLNETMFRDLVHTPDLINRSPTTTPEGHTRLSAVRLMQASACT